MSQTFAQILQSIPNTETRIALEKLFELLFQTVNSQSLSNTTSGAGHIGVGSVQLDTTFVDGTAEGRLQWNLEDGTLEYGLPGGNVNFQVGQEQLVRVKNDQGAQINNGQPVYVSGASGSRPEVKLADNDTGTPVTAWALGIATENIGSGQNGYVNTFGLVRDVDTSAFTAGDFLWLDNTPGTLTATRPPAPEWNIFMGMCLRSNAEDGIIFTKVVILPHLHGLSDVLEVAPNNGDVLKWVAANSRWEAQAP